MSVLTASPAVSPETASWVDGPRFVAWIDRMRPDREGLLPDTDTRRIYEAAHGSALSIWVADRILVRLDLHLLELPEEIFREDPRCGSRKRNRTNGGSSR